MSSGEHIPNLSDRIRAHHAAIDQERATRAAQERQRAEAAAMRARAREERHQEFLKGVAVYNPILEADAEALADAAHDARLRLDARTSLFRRPMGWIVKLEFVPRVQTINPDGPKNYLVLRSGHLQGLVLSRQGQLLQPTPDEASITLANGQSAAASRLLRRTDLVPIPLVGTEQQLAAYQQDLVTFATENSLRI